MIHMIQEFSSKQLHLESINSHELNRHGIIELISIMTNSISINHLLTEIKWGNSSNNTRLRIREMLICNLFINLLNIPVRLGTKYAILFCTDLIVAEAEAEEEEEAEEAEEAEEEGI